MSSLTVFDPYHIYSNYKNYASYSQDGRYVTNGNFIIAVDSQGVETYIYRPEIDADIDYTVEILNIDSIDSAYVESNYFDATNPDKVSYICCTNRSLTEYGFFDQGLLTTGYFYDSGVELPSPYSAFSADIYSTPDEPESDPVEETEVDPLSYWYYVIIFIIVLVIIMLIVFLMYKKFT